MQHTFSFEMCVAYCCCSYLFFKLWRSCNNLYFYQVITLQKHKRSETEMSINSSKNTLFWRRRGRFSGCVRVSMRARLEHEMDITFQLSPRELLQAPGAAVTPESWRNCWLFLVGGDSALSWQGLWGEGELLDLEVLGWTNKSEIK